MLVNEIMTVAPTVLFPDQTVQEALSILTTEPYSHLPVVEGEALVGMISDRDLSRTISPFSGTELERTRDRRQLMLCVRDIMSTNLVTVDKHTTVDYAAILLLEHQISCLPVINDQALLMGLLTWKDILQFYVYQSGDPADEHYEETFSYVNFDD